MENLLIHPTTFTPLVSFNTSHNVFTIAGCSYSDDIAEFYQPVQTWLTQYLKTTRRPIICHFQLDFSDLPSKQIFKLMFEEMETFSKETQVPVFINWFADKNDDEGIQEGKMFKTNFAGLYFRLLLEEKAL